MFIHALREEGDGASGLLRDRRGQIFTHALRKEGDQGQRRSPGYRAISTHALLAEGDRPYSGSAKIIRISTHALREEGDSKRWNSCCAPFNFYPRPPRGGRQTRFDFYHPMLAFLPTPSARRATNDGRQQRHHRRISTHALREEGDAPAAGVAALIVISTHALREEGDLYQYPTPDLTDISTHALREEGDPAGSSRSSHKARFLPTPSARRATDFFNVFTAVFVISTHALREEGDELLIRQYDAFDNFYPRPPRGGRRRGRLLICCHCLFLPTPSARRATPCQMAGAGHQWDFYPRPPRGGRPKLAAMLDGRGDFYPRPPRGGRLQYTADAFITAEISTHALREEGDVYPSDELAERTVDFYPRPPRGGRPRWPRCCH